MAVRLEFDDTGGGGAPVLLLHGLFGARGNWRSVARALAPSRRVVSVDLRNHGASPWADSMGYFEMADDVLRLIDRLGLERPSVLGHSMGGKVAMALALGYPGLLASLVVVDIAPVAYGDRFSSIARTMASIDAAAVTSRAEVQRLLAQTIPDAGTVAFLAQNLVAGDARFDWRINLAAISASMPDLCAFPADLSGGCFQGPTTLIAGGTSDFVSAADRAAFATLFPRLRCVEIDGAGHWVHADRPDEFVQAVQAALAEVRPARSQPSVA